MPGASVTLRILGRVREIPAADWDALLGEDSSPFMEHRWLDMLEEAGCVGGETGWVPTHLSMWEGDRLVAVAPSYAKGNSEGEFIFDWSWADFAMRQGLRYYPKIVVAVPFTPATGDRVLVAPGCDRARVVTQLASAAREWAGRAGASGVHCLFPREAEARAWEAAGYMRRDSFQFHWFREGAATFDDYLGRFNSKHRNQIKREVRGVEERGIVIETLTPEAHTVPVARTMHDLYSTNIDKHGVWGRHYLNERFFELLIDRFRDRLAWVVAREGPGGKIVAGAFNVVRGKRLYGRYWGTHVDVPFLHFAVCYYAGVRFCLERGLDVFEPGAGGEHKRARGFVPTITHSAHWIENKRMRAAIGEWLERDRERVQAIVDEG
jgi:predicted N-acyltransferase